MTSRDDLTAFYVYLRERNQMNMPPNEVPTGLKDKAAVWLFSQGASTVLLTLILAFQGYDKHYGEPQRYDQIQKGYEAIEERHDAVEKANRENGEKQLDRVLDVLRDNRRADKSDRIERPEKTASAGE